MSDVHRRTVTYKRVGRCAIGADLFIRRGTRPRALMVWIHGGALIGGSRRDLAPHQLDGYLGAGFAVVAIDYRLAPETPLPLIVGDVQDAYAWAVEIAGGELGLGPERVAVTGHSAGGYLALCLGQRGVPRPRAVVSFHGYGDILGSWYTQPDSFYLRQPIIPEAVARSGVGGPAISSAEGEERWRFYHYCRQHGSWVREVAGADLAADRRELETFCPARNVSAAFPPTMLVHGTDDDDVPFAQSQLMADALQRAGVDHELLAIDSHGHMFDTDPGDPEAATAFEAALSFLGKRLG